MASCDVRFPIRLEGLSYAHPQFSNVRRCCARSPLLRKLPCLTHGAPPQYEPELFPGLIYRMVTPKIVILIFVSGKVVLTGGKARQRRFPPACLAVLTRSPARTFAQSRSDVYEAFENIYPVLNQFRKVESAALAAPPPPAQITGGAA